MNKAEKIYKDRSEWFKTRVGKRVYRDKVSCRCATCNEIEKKGIVILNKTHAVYLTDISFELGIEYRDKK